MISWDFWASRVLPLIFTVTLGLFFYFLNKKKPRVWVPLGLTALAVVGFYLVALNHEKEFSETEISGLLRPASEPTPPTSCDSIPKDALILLFGDSASYTTQPHHTILNVAGKDLVSIDRKDGGIAITSMIFSADTRIVAKITDNKFDINPSNYFRRERPDHHTLEVFDQHDQRILYVRYLNSSTMKILGTFHTTKGIILVNENEVTLPGGPHLSKYCFGNNLVDIQVN